jgi:hypothetical protein
MQAKPGAARAAGPRSGTGHKCDTSKATGTTYRLEFYGFAAPVGAAGWS